MNEVDLDKYCIHQPRKDVAEFLAAHPRVSAILDECAAEIRNVFGEGIELGLEVVYDPEYRADKDLWMLIYVSDLEHREARNLLDEFDRAWLLKQPRARIRGFNVDITYG